MTKQEIVKALRYCSGSGFGYSLCGVCPLGDKPKRICRDLYRHAADQIESLTAELETTRHQLEQTKQKRDAWKLRAEAAVQELQGACWCCVHGMGYEVLPGCVAYQCNYHDSKPDRTYRYKCEDWEWRGPCAENGGIDNG